MSFRVIGVVWGSVAVAATAVAAPQELGAQSFLRPDNVVVRPDAKAPLSSMIAVWMPPGSEMDLGEFVNMRVQQVATDTLPEGVVFPVANDATDTVRTLDELGWNVVIKWFDPITLDNGVDAARFGANCDYIAYFGNGWNSDWEGDVLGSAPQFNGDGAAGWLWSNFEYISNGTPEVGSAPTGQHLTHAQVLADAGILNIDVTDDFAWDQESVNEYVRQHKRQLGGGWFRVFQGATGEWRVFRDPNAVRYDGTDSTLLRLVGQTLNEPDNDDNGVILPDGIVVGITGDCSGGQTPWGTVITAEENVQSYYGDLEPTWSSGQRFVPGNGFDAGANVQPTFEPSEGALWGLTSNPNERHARDVYGYLSEIDPGLAPDHFYTSANDGGDGMGHRKIGGMGRARWENACFAVDSDWKLVDGQPIVIYAGNDRRSGRIWKFVTSEHYSEGMTRAEVRALLDEGDLYVAHFEDLDAATGVTLFSTGESPTEDNRGMGRWIHMSVDSTDTPVNAEALGQPDITVGEALRDVNWNSLGGFPDDNTVRQALFTAGMKVGVSETNRPEDLEWNPNDPSGTPRIYVAFTNHTRQVALTQDGVLYDADEHADNSPNRGNPTGNIFALEETDPANPGDSTTFTYFEVWAGTLGDGTFDAADPDNLAIARDGGLWFGTDGNFGVNGGADSVYYLDLDPSRKEGQPGIVNPTFGKAFRVFAGPSDSEATGPTFSSDMRSLFANVQHPGERVPSTWPQNR